MHPLLTSAVRHFPMCNEFGLVFGTLRRHLTNSGIDAEEADDALLRASAAVFAETVDAETLQGNETDAMNYVCMVRVLLDARKRPADDTEAEEEQDDTFETARASSTDKSRPGKKQRPAEPCSVPEKVDTSQLEEGETTE